jgi:hypothetical protein
MTAPPPRHGNGDVGQRAAVVENGERHAGGEGDGEQRHRGEQYRGNRHHPTGQQRHAGLGDHGQRPSGHYQRGEHSGELGEGGHRAPPACQAGPRPFTADTRSARR